MEARVAAGKSKAFRAFQRWLIADSIVVTVLLAVLVVTLLVLHKREVLTNSSFQLWLIAGALTIAVASSSLIGFRISIYARAMKAEKDETIDGPSR